jgi:dephospho-CoA kinase
MILLGLTGSIGMGKTTAARLFAEEGIPVHDSDAAVHALYAPGGAAVDLVEAAFPGVVRDGAVDRARLAECVAGDPSAMARLEGLVHPLVAQDRQAFLQRAHAAPVAVLDVPLLFETGGEALVDAVVVVSTTPEIQRERVLGRPGMTEARFEAILARQVPDAVKRARADFVVDSGFGIEAARDQIRRILKAVTAPGWRSPRRSGP